MLNGGEKLLEHLENLSNELGKGSVVVGFLEGATYPDGETVAEVAFTNEFGNKKQPPRPFFRQMIDKEKSSWPGKIGKLAKVTNFDGQRVLGILGSDIEGALRDSINSLMTPELSPVTIEAKGFSKPLIDTAHMINSISFEVHDE